MGRAATAGLLCSAVPMVADLLALRRVPAGFFGVFMSVNPVFAALTGFVVLGQSLEFADWLAIAAIVTANAISVSAAGRTTAPERPTAPGRPTARGRPTAPGRPTATGGVRGAGRADPEPEPAA